MSNVYELRWVHAQYNWSDTSGNSKQCGRYVIAMPVDNEVVCFGIGGLHMKNGEEKPLRELRDINALVSLTKHELTLKKDSYFQPKFRSVMSWERLAQVSFRCCTFKGATADACLKAAIAWDEADREVEEVVR